MIFSETADPGESIDEAQTIQATSLLIARQLHRMYDARMRIPSRIATELTVVAADLELVKNELTILMTQQAEGEEE